MFGRNEDLLLSLLLQNLINQQTMAKSILLCISLWIFTYQLHAQGTETISFVHIGLDDGLSQSTVFDIAQDKYNNMWFATYNGLNKYDGYTFTVYQHNEKKASSLGCDIVRSLKTDDQGRIWVGTYEGLSLYDYDKERFLNFQYKKGRKNMPVNKIVTVNEELLLIYTDGELILFNTHTQSFSKSQLNPDLFMISPTSINRQGDNIYIGSREGLFSYSISQNTIISIAPDILKGKHISVVLQQSPTLLWVGTEGNGLYLINPLNNKAKQYTATSETPHAISSNYIRVLSLDTQNRLWVGTINSLNIYQKESDSFSIYESNPLKEGSLSQASIRSIFVDSQGGMWLGTFFGGLNYYHPLKNRFLKIQSIPNRNSLNDNVINYITEDKDNNLWIGTNSGGVNFYNFKNNTFTHYTQKEGLGSNDVKTIYVNEQENKVYIGVHAGGISILHRKTGRIETFTVPYSSGIAAKSVYAIVPIGNGEYWVGTLGGMLRFNPSSKTFTPVTTEKDGKPLRSKRITTIFKDSKQRFWLGSETGLIVYAQDGTDLQSIPVFPPESSLNQCFINSIYEGRNGIFWIGTRNGIYRFNEATGASRQYTTEEGLPNNVVFGILEDSEGKLWISTDRGLSCFHPQNEKFRNFASNDGLQSNQFTASAYCHTANGKMYFGGIKGITAFQPEKIIDNPYTPPVTITRLRLFNKKVMPEDGTRILKTNIRETRSITLTAKQSMFSLNFVVPNYISGKHNMFAYILKGYDKEWYYTNNQHTVSYSNLPAGTYHFLVKAANNDGKWNEKPTELEITILPVWYKTWWAILLFITIFIAITILIFRYFWMRKSMQSELQLERIDKERQKEVNEMKLRFFINISHELRTPLTLILAPVQEMLDKVNDQWLLKQLEHVQRNTNRLLHLVNQLMDYRRAELGVFHLKVRLTPIHKLIEKNFLFYERLALRKKISYNLSSEVEGRIFLCDPNYLELIINNLLSNAFKHTNSGKSISVALKDTGNELLLQVKDTGNGIPIDKQAKIFERFYQINNEHTGSGIGLSLVQRLVELHHGRIELESREGEGSTFSIYLPTEEAAYQPEEIVTDKEFLEEQQVYTTNSKEMYVLNAENDQSDEKIEEQKEKRQERILIVEDNPDIRLYLSNELGKSYHIVETGNGEEALSVMKEQKIDLILTDVMMPVMDGLQLCRLIKQNLRTCHIPIIILSAKTDLREQLEGLQGGADDYIPKPFSMPVLTTKIKNLFRTRYRAIEHYSNSLEIEPEKVALNPMDEELLKNAVAIVEKHIDDVEFSTDDFAREICMSRSNLHLKLKALTGDTTNDFIRKIRFSRACKLLKEERYTIAEISIMVGFNTPSYFSASFKKYFGCLPSEYIKSNTIYPCRKILS